MKRIFYSSVIILSACIAFAGSMTGSAKAGDQHGLRTDSINTKDTIFIDLCHLIANGNNIHFPAYFRSDDVINAVDFSFVPDSKLTYDSITKIKSYMNPTGNVSGGVFYFSSYSTPVMDNNQDLVYLWFNSSTGKMGAPDLTTIKGYLNGDPCTVKVIDTSFACRVGIDEIANAHSMQVYPNPTTGNAFVKFNVSKGSSYDLTLTDIIGNTVLKKNGQIHGGDNVLPLDLSTLNKGIYFITIQTADTRFGKRIIVE